MLHLVFVFFVEALLLEKESVALLYELLQTIKNRLFDKTQVTTQLLPVNESLNHVIKAYPLTMTFLTKFLSYLIFYVNCSPSP